MSEDTSVPTTTDTDGAPATEPTTDPAGIESLPEWAQKELRQARRDAASYRTQLREAEPLMAKARELEDAQKTQAERLQDALSARDGELSALKAELTRSRVLRQFGLPDEMAEFLSGDDAAMTAAGERLAAITSKAGVLRSAPVERLQSGASAQNADADDFDPEALADAIVRRKIL